MDKAKLCGILFSVMLFVLPLACSKKKAPFAPREEAKLQQAETTPVSFTPTPEETVSSTPTPLASPTPTPTFQNVQICTEAGDQSGEFPVIDVAGLFSCNPVIEKQRFIVDQPAPLVADPYCDQHPVYAMLYCPLFQVSWPKALK